MRHKRLLVEKLQENLTLPEYGEVKLSFTIGMDGRIEKSKTGAISQTAITEGFTKLLKLLHPFVPFVTEDVWSKFNASDLLITSDWPA